MKIRLINEKDSKGVFEIYSYYVNNTAVTFEEEVPSVDSITGRIQSILEETPWLVCVSAGKVAGYAYASPHRVRSAYRWTKEVSVYIHPDFRRRNIARSLYLALFELLKLQGVHSVLAGITLPNESSTKLHRTLGFDPIGTYPEVGYKLGKWHDVTWWMKRIGDGNQSAFTPFCQGKNLAGWESVIVPFQDQIRPEPNDPTA